MILSLIAQAAAPVTAVTGPWWTSPFATIGGPIIALLLAELIRRKNSSVSDTASIQVEHLKSMAALAQNERDERHKLSTQFNAQLLLLQVEISNMGRVMEWIKSAFSELYYSHQRSWDAFEAFIHTLRHDNPTMTIPENSLPKRPDIAHLAPIKIFRPNPDFSAPPPPQVIIASPVPVQETPG